MRHKTANARFSTARTGTSRTRRGLARYLLMLCALPMVCTPAWVSASTRVGDPGYNLPRVVPDGGSLWSPTPVSGQRGAPSHEIVLVLGAPGEPQYAERFLLAAEAWRKAAEQAHARLTVIGAPGTPPAKAAAKPGVAPTTAAEKRDGPVSSSDKDRLRAALGGLSAVSAVPAWLVYVGHGTFDGKNAWLNLDGPDVSNAELAEWIRPLGERTLVIVHGGSAGAPLLPTLSHPGRIVISATRNGDETNYARFGERFAEAIAAPSADLDQDGTTSLLEAFLWAGKQTEAYYAENGRMATEHALLDDNGDKLGTPADWFQGVRVIKRPDDQKAAPDGFRAHQLALLETPTAAALTAEQRARRDALERELEQIRARRDTMPEPEYLRELERVLRQLGEFYR